jgi:rare lipoprotein A
MMSIPGISNPLAYANNQPTIDPSPAAIPSPQLVVPGTPAKKPSFFKRVSNNIGMASWYGAVLNGHKTASGETFDMNQMTACHRTLPFGTMVRVVDLHSGKSVIVRINDRGVLFRERIIDLSRGAADKLGIRKAGVASVRLEVLSKKQAADSQVAAATEKSGPTADSSAGNDQ